MPGSVPQFGQLFWTGGADDRADETVSGFAAIRLSPLQQAPGHVPVKWLAIDGQVLEFSRRRVTGADRARKYPSVPWQPP